jgi:amino acid transporter
MTAAAAAAMAGLAIVATIVVLVVVLFVDPNRGRMNLFATLRPASARLKDRAVRPRPAMRRD